jgi:hypothetical protein
VRQINRNRDGLPQLLLVAVEERAALLFADAVVLEHAGVDAHVLALYLESGFGRDGVQNKVVVAVGAILVGLVVFVGIVLAEALFALLAGEGELRVLQERVVLGFAVALGAVEPLAACSVSGEVVGREGVQQGERMATWALRTCLLEGQILLVALGRLPHGDAVRDGWMDVVVFWSEADGYGGGG